MNKIILICLLLFSNLALANNSENNNELATTALHPKKMKWELPDEEVTTIAGLLLFETGSIPKIGSLFAICGFIFEVIEKKKHQITKIKISKLEK